MALELTYDSLRREVGRFLGYRPSTTDWTSTEAQVVADVLDDGLRRFYWPMALEAGKAPHQWSFLSPDATLAVTSATDAYDLPSDFTDISSKGFSFASGDKLVRVSRTDDETIRVLKAQANRSGPPQFFAISVKSTIDSSPTRYEVRFFPTPDATYSLSYQYNVTPSSLSELNSTPLGGARHAKTILEACLAEAEKKIGDEEGIHEKKFMELLSASIAADRELAKPEVGSVWPFENQQGDLKITKGYLKRLIGVQLGYGPHQGLWDFTQTQKVKLALETGLRKFYAPPCLPQEKYSHNWSFLKTDLHLTMVEDQYAYDLPDGFAMLTADDILQEPGTSQLYPPVKLVSERQVLSNLQNVLSAGRPQLAAYRSKLNEEFGTKYEILFWPTPDDEYELNIRYTVNPGMMQDDTSLPLGHQSCHQAIIEACLAACEEQLGTPGLHSQLFAEAIRSAVSQDRKVASPDSLGPNYDPSDVPVGSWMNWHACNTNIITYNGQTY